MSANVRITRSCVNIALTIICLWLSTFKSNIIVTKPKTTSNVSLCTSTMSYDEISCHYIELDDNLLPKQNHRFQSTKKHKYFHETTCRGFFDPDKHV